MADGKHITEIDLFNFRWGDSENPNALQHVGAVSVNMVEGTEWVFTCLVVLNFPEMEVVYKNCQVTEFSKLVDLSDDIDKLMELNNKITTSPLSDLLHKMRTSHSSMMPQLLFVEGDGRLPTGGLGLAAVLGSAVDIPCIGIRDSLTTIDEQTRSSIVQYLEKGVEAVALRDAHQQVWGAAMRSKQKTLCVGVGHRLKLSTALEIVKAVSGSNGVPVPLRQLHTYVTGVKKELKSLHTSRAKDKQPQPQRQPQQQPEQPQQPDQQRAQVLPENTTDTVAYIPPTYHSPTLSNSPYGEGSILEDTTNNTHSNTKEHTQAQPGRHKTGSRRSRSAHTSSATLPQPTNKAPSATAATVAAAVAAGNAISIDSPPYCDLIHEEQICRHRIRNEELETWASFMSYVRKICLHAKVNNAKSRFASTGSTHSSPSRPAAYSGSYKRNSPVPPGIKEAQNSLLVSPGSGSRASTPTIPITTHNASAGDSQRQHHVWSGHTSVVSQYEVAMHTSSSSASSGRISNSKRSNRSRGSSASDAELRNPTPPVYSFADSGATGGGGGGGGGGNMHSSLRKGSYSGLLCNTATPAPTPADRASPLAGALSRLLGPIANIIPTVSPVSAASNATGSSPNNNTPLLGSTAAGGTTTSSKSGGSITGGSITAGSGRSSRLDTVTPTGGMRNSSTGSRSSTSKKTQRKNSLSSAYGARGKASTPKPQQGKEGERDRASTPTIATLQKKDAIPSEAGTVPREEFRTLMASTSPPSSRMSDDSSSSTMSAITPYTGQHIPLGHPPATPPPMFGPYSFNAYSGRFPPPSTPGYFPHSAALPRTPPGFGSHSPTTPHTGGFMHRTPYM